MGLGSGLGLGLGLGLGSPIRKRVLGVHVATDVLVTVRVDGDVHRPPFVHDLHLARVRVRVGVRLRVWLGLGLGLGSGPGLD